MRSSAALFAAAVFFSGTAPGHAGPCSAEIAAMQIKIDAKLNAKAAAGPAGQESAAATEHRQPTPESIAKAEEKLGDVSANQVDAVGAAMARARAADRSGDAAGCRGALADASKALAD